MKKVLSIFSLFLAFSYMAKAGEVTTQPDSIVVAIEANSLAGSVSVIGTSQSQTIGNITYAWCYVGTEISLEATAKTGYLFQEWSGNDPAHAYNLIPTEDATPYTFTLFADAGFIQLEAGVKWLDTIKVKASFRDATVCDSTFTITEHGFFVTAVDALGSTLALDSTTLPPTIKYDQVKKDNVLINDWPWNDVTFHFSQAVEDSFHLSKNVLAVQVTYKADHIFKMALPFNAALMAGGGSHMVILPVHPVSSTDMKVYTAYMDQFTWPAWYTDHQTALDLDSVESITFALDENAETAGYKGTMQIESIKLCGLTRLLDGVNNQQLNQLTDLSINGLWNNSINISANNAGKYNVAVYTIEGKAVYSTYTTLNKGNNSISLNQNLENGSYMIYVSNDKGAQAKTIGMVK